MNLRSIIIACLFLSVSISIYPQEVDITDALKKVEVGKVEEANSLLQQLKQTNPSDPSIAFLDAVLTKDGNEALKKYSIVFEKFPKSKYADAALFRVFSFYYSLGSYKKAETYLDKLKNEYPLSPYILAADRNIPVEDEVIGKSKSEFVKDEVKIKIVPVEETKTTNANFTIQAGAFLNLDNAKRLSDQLSKDGLHTEISIRDIGGSQLNVVSTGKFATEADAKKVLSSIESKYNIKGRVISLTNK